MHSNLLIKLNILISIPTDLTICEWNRFSLWKQDVEDVFRSGSEYTVDIQQRCERISQQ